MPWDAKVIANCSHHAQGNVERVLLNRFAEARQHIPVCPLSRVIQGARRNRGITGLSQWRNLEYAELHELLPRTLAEDGYARVEVRMTPILTEVIIHATRLREVLVENGRRTLELTAVVQ